MNNERPPRRKWYSVNVYYYECPHNEDHIFDIDDPNLGQTLYKGYALCPYDSQILTRMVADVEVG